MLWSRALFAAALLAALSLGACAGLETARPRPVFVTAAILAPPPITSPASPPPTSFSALAGWADENHAAALAAFEAGCGASRDPALAAVCEHAREIGPLDEPRARAFFETHFRLEPVAGTGWLTAYFTPAYEARALPGGEFTAPVRPRPADLHGGGPGLAQAYAERSSIEVWPSADALAWMRPEELFFLQIQGSGTLTFPDGSRSRAVFDGSNGARFVGLATPMRRQNLLADQDTSAEAIRAWLAANRGPRAAAIMRLDPRYVFFRLEKDDGGNPVGAAGVPLVARRALAVDPRWHAMGELLWVDAQSPVLAGAFPAYRGLAMALDTGGAIQGEARADLYLGRGPEAGVEAGRVRHVLHLYRLSPLPQQGE